jgi:hypothetical protein
MAKKTPPFPKYPDWTEARFWSFVRSALRQAHIKWPPAQNVMKQGRKAVTGKKHKFEHQCTHCKKWFPQKDIEKDHIVEAGSLKCYSDLPGFVERLFVSESGYRKLCKSCHNKVTHGG